jgi:hypothetical protein
MRIIIPSNDQNGDMIRLSKYVINVLLGRLYFDDNNPDLAEMPNMKADEFPIVKDQGRTYIMRTSIVYIYMPYAAIKSQLGPIRGHLATLSAKLGQGVLNKYLPLYTNEYTEFRIKAIDELNTIKVSEGAPENKSMYEVVVQDLLGLSGHLGRPYYSFETLQTYFGAIYDYDGRLLAKDGFIEDFRLQEFKVHKKISNISITTMTLSKGKYNNSIYTTLYLNLNPKYSTVDFPWFKRQQLYVAKIYGVTKQITTFGPQDTICLTLTDTNPPLHLEATKTCFVCNFPLLGPNYICVGTKSNMDEVISVCTLCYEFETNDINYSERYELTLIINFQQDLTEIIKANCSDPLVATLFLDLANGFTNDKNMILSNSGAAIILRNINDAIAIEPSNATIYQLREIE